MVAESNARTVGSWSEFDSHRALWFLKQVQQMPDVKIIRVEGIVTDDKADGIFWRDGERFLRERGKEFRLRDLAPHLEASAMMELLMNPDSPAYLAMEKSKVKHEF